MTTTTAFDLIFDNGGNIILQTPDYAASFYGEEETAAESVAALLRGETTDGWDGNDPELRMEYDYDVERSGGYRWLTADDVREALAVPAADRDAWLERISGRAEREFFAALFGSNA